MYNILVSKNRILVIEDDEGIATSISERITFEGWEARVVSDGSVAIEAIREFQPDAIVLDLMLPGLNGFEITEQVRRFSDVPIIVLTARSQDEDQIKMFEIGADDYLIKPMKISILISHIKVWLKRYEHMKVMYNKNEQTIFEGANVKLDTVAHVVTRVFDGVTHEVLLTPTEFALIYTFIKEPNKVFSRDYLLKEIWDWDMVEGTRTVDSHIKSLRKKLTACGAADPVKTVHGVGYKLNVVQNFD